jgi:hypothetical protein
MTPADLAKSGTESGHQRALMCWAALPDIAAQYPEFEFLLFAIANGGSRGDSEKSRKIRGAALKAEGVKAGVADLMLAVRRGEYPGLYIEMKKPASEKGRAGKPSDKQIKFKRAVQAQGYGWVCCVGWEAARDTIVEYMRHG